MGTKASRRGGIRIFSTCPPSGDAVPGEYRQRVAEIARWSEAAGCEGILIYTDNRLVDPWAVAQVVLESTRTLAPLVAVQPAYMHPYAVAKKVASLAFLFGRRICLNMVAGGFLNDLAALGDHTPHDARYHRLIEYTLIVRRLLEGPGSVSFDGRYYRVRHLQMIPALPRHLFPEILVSGSSDDGLQAARDLGATAIKYPRPPHEATPESDPPPPLGIRIGIISAATRAEAWQRAHARFPGSRRGQLTHQLALHTSDSCWHRQLAEADDADGAGAYWLWPFRNYSTFCPYLVGSREDVGRLLADYLTLGYRTVILDIPASVEELAEQVTLLRSTAPAEAEP